MKKLMKLALVTVVLTGSLAVGAPVRTANAQEVCGYTCCDPECTRIIPCEAFGTWCVCNWGCPGYEQIDP
jgi:hypothetical protein